MKKLLAIVLTLVLVLGMGTVALATGNDDTPPLEDQTSVNLSKIYKITNGNTANPVETFHFEIEKESVTDSQYTKSTMPMFDPATFAISFNNGDATTDGNTKSADIMLPPYEHVGIFTYKITETKPTEETAGVDYDEREFYLTVTVINKLDNKGNLIKDKEGKPILLRRVTSLYYYYDEGEIMQKSQNFLNEFSAGSLSIIKNVTGNMGEKDRYFEVTVTLYAPSDKTVKDAVNVLERGSYVAKPDDTTPGNPATVTVGTETVFHIKHDETITLGNIPYDVTYKVEENIMYEAEPYNYDKATYEYLDKDADGNNTGITGVIDSGLEIAKVINNKERTVETGINLDSLPYLIILAVAIGGLFLFVTRRRMASNE